MAVFIADDEERSCPMIFQVSHRAIFRRLPWSAPLRSALSWQPDPAQFPDDAPLPDAPRWLRPLCVQRMVGRAVAQRAAWLASHLCLDPYRFGRESEPDWHECNLLTYDRRNLRELSERSPRWLLGMEVERLLRLVQLSPSERGEAAWLAGVLAASEHVALVYHELRRRYKAARARAILREDLAAFVTWRGRQTRKKRQKAGNASTAVPKALPVRGVSEGKRFASPRLSV
jgi:hypothetical protein